MKKEATEHLVNFLKNFNYEIVDLKIFKLKQPNNKPAYQFWIATKDFPLNLVVSKNNANNFVVNSEISSYEFSNDAFNDLVKKTLDLTKKREQLISKQENTPNYKENKEKNINIRNERKLKIK